MSFANRIAGAGLLFLFAAGAALAQTSGSSATNAPAPTPEQQKILQSAEKFLRNYFAWDDTYQVKVGPLGPAPSANFYTVPIQITYKDQTNSGDVYVSKDGKTLLRGEILDMTTDNFAENRTKLHATGSPSIGPADASVTMFEFYDFECPHCREADGAVKTLADQYKIRVVYKNFPLKTIHPWAETAAVGAQCAFMQSSDAFFKMHDLIFENQDVILPDTVTDKLTDFATQVGLNAEMFKACMAGGEAAKKVQADEDEGRSLDVDSTPTFFVNGRQTVGGDVATLQRLIIYEQAKPSK